MESARFVCKPSQARSIAACAMVGALWLWTAQAVAYPIPAQTLWDLTRTADLVVLARVEHVEPLVTSDDSWSSAQAVLKVREVWKRETPVEHLSWGAAIGASLGWRGEIGTGDRLNVPFPAGLLCPAPPHYAAGEVVVAFLERGEDGDLSTVALSYGTLYPDPLEIPIYRNLVKQAVAAPADPTASDQARLRWAVDAAVEPATRWHGAYLLMPAADRMHAYYDRGSAAAAAPALAPNDLKRLEQALLKAPVLDVTFPMLLGLLRDTKSTDLDALAVAVVDTLLKADRQPYWLADMLTLTRARVAPPARSTEGSDPNECSAEVCDPLLGGLAFDVEVARREWTALRSTLALPERKVPWPPLPRTKAVGPDTPP